MNNQMEIFKMRELTTNEVDQVSGGEVPPDSPTLAERLGINWFARAVLRIIRGKPPLPPDVINNYADQRAGDFTVDGGRQTINGAGQRVSINGGTNVAR